MPFMSVVSRLKSNCRVRRLVCAGLVAAASSLTLVAAIFNQEVLAALAVLSWAILFLALYLSLRIRLGHLVVTGEQRHRDVANTLEVAASHQRRFAEDQQQMQLRIYRDICTRLVEIQTALASLNSSAESTKSKVDAVHHEADGFRQQLELHQRKFKSLDENVHNGTQEIIQSLRDHKRVRKVTQEGMQWMKTELVQEVESLLRLYGIGHDRDGSPLLGGWAMDPAGMLGTLKLIDDTDPETIVELGSGTSTLWIAEHLRQRGKGRLISIDHLEEYASVTRQNLQDRGLLDVAEVRLAPLKDIEVHGRSFRWYDTSEMADIERIDFLLVDGPPTATGPLARYPALPLLGKRLRQQACVLLDDASRQDEKDAISLWLNEGHLLSSRTSLGGRVAAFNVKASERSGMEEKDF